MKYHSPGSPRPRSRLGPPLLALGLALPAPGLLAQYDEAAFLAELPVVLSATRLKQSRHDTPAAVTVIDRHMIEASGARTLVDVLRLVPGMVTGFATGNHHPRHAAEEQGIYTRLTRGSDDIGDVLLRHGGRQGALDYRISFQYQQDSGFDGVTRYRDRIWDNHDWSRGRRLTGRADYQFNATDRWEIQAGIAESPQGKGALFSDLSDPPRTQDKENNFVQLRWERSNATGHEFHVQFHRDEHVTRDEVLIGPVTEALDAATVNQLTGIPLEGTLTASALLDGYLRTQRHDLEVQHRYSPAQGTRFVWGGSLRMDRVRSEGWFNRDDWLYHHLYRVFGNAEVPVTDRLKLNLGTMLEHNDIIGHDLSPRLAANYRLHDRHSLRAAWSRASRTPAMIEEFGHLVGSIDANLAIPNVRARLQGIETQLDWRPSTHTMVRFGHAYIDIDSDDVQEEFSQSAPRNSYLLFASHRFPRRIDASLAWHYTERMQWLEWESIDAISRLDLRFAKGFRLGHQRAQLALVGQNILGDHVEFRRGNRFDPRIFIQLSLAPD
ncbi:MAG: TonB-dependent receptor [Xanthomonadaceae bacterium]|nr:TonB-dependent receptor [Xanthomonadaceae bacterium]